MTKLKKTLRLGLLFLVCTGAVVLLVYLCMPKPCEEPLTYRLGRIDERFGITRTEFSMAVRKAAAVWGKPLARELFREDPQGAIEINLIYDYRQETSDKLKQLDYKMDGSTDSIQSMKMRYESLKAEHEKKTASLEVELQSYNARINAYNAKVEFWNREGGVPQTQRIQLTSEKNELDSFRESFRMRREEVKNLSDEINTLSAVINEIVAGYNQDVDHYRDVGSRLAGEFQEGFFESKDGKQSITVYHFDNGEKLVRLLVHELGHALRLPHSENSQAVMYRLNQYDTAELTADDIAALKIRCEK